MNKALITEAFDIKRKYKAGIITRKHATDLLRPYEEAYNQHAKELAKKYNRKAEIFNFTAFMRS